MVKIDISEDMAHSLFREMLAQDYRRIARDIAETTSGRDVSDLDIEDLGNWRRWHDAMTQLLDYYFTEEEARELSGNG